MTDSSRTEPAAAESPAAEAPLRFADLDLPAPLLEPLGQRLLDMVERGL